MLNGGALAYPATWYAATTNTDQVRPALTGTAEADVCVIGGGLAGLSVACELAERRAKVVVLEARRLGSGASGLNGGFVSSGFAAHLRELEGKLGPAAAHALYRLSMEGTEIVRSRTRELSPEILMGEGMILALRHRDSDRLNSYGAQLRETFGRDIRYLTREELTARLKSNVYFDGLHDAGAFHIHPLRYVAALAHRAEREGAVLHEGSRVIQVGRSGAELVARTRRTVKFAPGMSSTATAPKTGICFGGSAAPCCRLPPTSR